MNGGFRTLLVIGDNHEAIASKYSLDTKVEPYIRYKFEDAETLHIKYLNILEEMIKKYQAVSPSLSEKYKDMYDEYREMDDFEYYQQLTYGCNYDENGDAWSTQNPNAEYQYEKCHDKRIRQDQRNEGNFSIPFTLKDGKKAYSALKNEIDWPKNHMNNTEIYKAAWEICVNGKEPETDEEKLIKRNFSNRHDYFRNFKSVEEYISHNCSFWCYGVATECKYVCADMDNAIEWTTNFYNRFVKNLPETERLSIYEIKLL
jgi:hypothetical protein